jgi:uncharacterized protein YndB with AHSA1/START domain
LIGDAAEANMQPTVLRRLMSTNTFPGIPVGAIREWKRYSPSVEPLSISVTASVNADRHRLFQALTVPEYIEAWFSAPGAIEGRTEVFSIADFLSISYSSVRGGRFTILCAYKVCRRNKLLLTWEHVALSGATPSMVKIRLLGDFGRTTVHVTHIGVSPSNQQWHTALWESSLRKLGKLF